MTSEQLANSSPEDVPKVEAEETIESTEYCYTITVKKSFVALFALSVAVFGAAAICIASLSSAAPVPDLAPYSAMSSTPVATSNHLSISRVSPGLHPRHRALQTHVDQKFAIDLSDATCDELIEVPISAAGTRQACRDRCAADPGCDTWMWCEYGKCRYVKGGNWVETAGNAAKCYVTDGLSPRSPCRPDKQMKWIGATWYPGRIKKRGSPSPIKRGFSGYSGPTYKCDDASLLGLENSWHHNGLSTPSERNECRWKIQVWNAGANRDGEIQMSKEFVPTVQYGEATTLLADLKLLKEWERNNAHYLMTYNYTDVANLPSPKDAAADFVNIIDLANAFVPALMIVSPAAPFEVDGSSQWMTDFLNECRQLSGCETSKIRYMNVHDYSGVTKTLEDKILAVYTAYERPVWVGGFGFEGVQSFETNKAYLESTLPMLESHPGVFRYQWANARTSYMDAEGGLYFDNRDMIRWKGWVTPVGEAYRDIPRTNHYEWPEDKLPTQ